MPSEVAARADFSRIRYAQVWEDADVLLDGLAVQPNDVCLSIASAGDNALALLAAGPQRVVALDLNPAQLACLALRVAAFRRLEYREILELLGSRPSERRRALYQALRGDLTPDVRDFWDAQPERIADGVGNAGKFENYFRVFRSRVLPWVHSRATVRRLLEPRGPAERLAFYETVWNTWRWRAMFRVFFSRTVMGKLGRDPSFFQYVEGSVADRILSRTRHALTVLSPAENPYLHVILTGQHGTALPFYLREENVARIRAHLDRLEWHLAPLEDFLDREPAGTFSKFNLSDLFEYLAPASSDALLRRVVAAARPGGRLLYWNMLAPRQAPPDAGVVARTELAADLLARDKAFFYSRVIVEDVP